VLVAQVGRVGVHVTVHVLGEDGVGGARGARGHSGGGHGVVGGVGTEGVATCIGG
jgi:hypothetical protein